MNIADLAVDLQMCTIVCFNKSALKERLQVNFIVREQVRGLVSAETPADHKRQFTAKGL